MSGVKDSHPSLSQSQVANDNITGDTAMNDVEDNICSDQMENPSTEKETMKMNGEDDIDETFQNVALSSSNNSRFSKNDDDNSADESEDEIEKVLASTATPTTTTFSSMERSSSSSSSGLPCSSKGTVKRRGYGNGSTPTPNTVRESDTIASKDITNDILEHSEALETLGTKEESQFVKLNLFEVENQKPSNHDENSEHKDSTKKKSFDAKLNEEDNDYVECDTNGKDKENENLLENLNTKEESEFVKLSFFERENSVNNKADDDEMDDSFFHDQNSSQDVTVDASLTKNSSPPSLNEGDARDADIGIDLNVANKVEPPEKNEKGKAENTALANSRITSSASLDDTSSKKNELESNDETSKTELVQESKKLQAEITLEECATDLSNELKQAVDELFGTIDPDKVTVKLFCNELEKRIGGSKKISKPVKKLVKSRLLGLLSGDIVNGNESGQDDPVDKEKEEGEDWDEESFQGDISSDGEVDADDEWEKEEKQTKKTKKGRPTPPTRSRKGKREPKRNGTKVEEKSIKKKDKKSRKKEIALDKKSKELRWEANSEARVRDEEMEGLQEIAEEKIHEEDRRRQEAIMARLEADEERLQTLFQQDRSILLQKLFQKRQQTLLSLSIAIEDVDEGQEAPAVTLNNERLTKTEAEGTPNAPDAAVESTSDDSNRKPDSTKSSHEDDSKPSFSTIGRKDAHCEATKKKYDPSKVPSLSKPMLGRGIFQSEGDDDELVLRDDSGLSSDEDGLEIDVGDKCSPTKAKKPQSALSILSRKFVEADVKRHKQKKQEQMNVNPRLQLRDALKQKARSAGNAWLARELGYKTEQEHLKDCEVAENARKEVLRKQELKKHEILRHNLFRDQNNLHQEEFDDDGAFDDEAATVPVAGDDDDEEMQLAKEIEEEAKREAKDIEEFHESSEKNNLLPSYAPDEETDFSAVSFSDPTNEGNGDNQTKAALPDNADKSGQKRISRTANDDDEIPSLAPSLSNEGAQDVENVIGISKTTTTDTVEKDVSAELSSKMSKEGEVTVLVTVKPDTVACESSDPSAASNVAKESTNIGAEMSQSAEKDLITAQPAAIKESEQETEMKAKARKENRNAAWKAMLAKEAKISKKKKSTDMVEDEASEEEEEMAVVGLEDFGFGVINKNKQKDETEEEDRHNRVHAGDLDGIVDELSDEEGDEEAGHKARQKMEAREEKERHKAMLRRMRDGYDGRRGGIASDRGAGTRGVHRFDQLIAADDKEEARRLGLLNDDELDSDDDDSNGEETEHDGNAAVDEEEDEALLLDRMLKDRHMNRADDAFLFSENESDDDDDDDDDDGQLETQPGQDGVVDEIVLEDAEQKRLAKRFTKRARMNRFFEVYGDSLMNEQAGTDSQLFDDNPGDKKASQASLSAFSGRVFTEGDESLTEELDSLPPLRPSLLSRENSSSAVTVGNKRKGISAFSSFSTAKSKHAKCNATDVNETNKENEEVGRDKKDLKIGPGNTKSNDKTQMGFFGARGPLSLALAASRSGKRGNKRKASFLRSESMGDSSKVSSSQSQGSSHFSAKAPVFAVSTFQSSEASQSGTSSRFGMSRRTSFSRLSNSSRLGAPAKVTPTTSSTGGSLWSKVSSSGVR